MPPMARDVLVAAAGGLLLVGYIAFVVQYLPMGVTRLAISLSLMLLTGFVVGALMKGGLGARVGTALIIPLAHFLYEGIDGAKPALSVIAYAIETLVVWAGLLVAYFVFRGRRGANAPAA
jgi:hypothetical protein